MKNGSDDYRYPYNTDIMENYKNPDVIIVGGSYAGLSAGMALGRSLRRVLIIDSGMPCNRQTPHSHNFITQDGETPANIAQKAKKQVLAYDTVQFLHDTVIAGKKIDESFQIQTASGAIFTCKKLIFATGIKDIIPDIEGFAACWGISVIHCPYCHGYEARDTKTGILANGDFAFHYAQLVHNLTKDITIFTNGKADFDREQLEKLERHKIRIIEKKIALLDHREGRIEQVVFANGSSHALETMYARPDFVQHSLIPEDFGCELTEQGLLKTDFTQQTTVEGLFACGDNSNMMRSVAYAVATGNIAGAVVNHQLSDADF